MMFPSHAPGFTLSGGIVAAVAMASAALVLLVLAALLRRKRPVVTGSEALIGAEGEAVSWQDGEGRVRVKGEIWLARSQASGASGSGVSGSSLAAGSRVKIVGRDGLILRVEGLGSA